MTPEPEDAPNATPSEPQTSWAPLSARDFAARFAAVEVLFEGREGKTYRARDRSREGREVALQVLLARAGRPLEAVERFFQDVRTAQSLVSQHLVEIVDVGGLEDGRLFVATELVQGESLAARLAREGELKVEVALEIARQTLAALAVAHEKSIAHGALEPRHVQLAARVRKTDENPDGIHVRLQGFGLGTLLAAEQPDAVAPTVAGDLAAVAGLVEAMVGPAAAAADARVRALVARVRGGGAQGVESAQRFATAIESSAATTPKSALPRWAIAGLALFGIAAITEGFLFLEARSDKQKLELLNAEASLQRTEALRAQEAWCGARMEELQESIKKRDEQITALGRKLEDELAAGEQREDATKSREELERMRRELDATKSEREKLAASLVDTQNRAKELEREKQRILLENTPGVRAARGFDRLLELVAAGKGREALAHFEELAKTDALDAKNDRAAAWMREFANAAASLEAAKEDDHPAEALTRARSSLAAIADLERAFAVEAAVWRAGGFDDGGDVDRAANGERAVSALAAKIAAASQGLEGEHGADWKRLEALSRRSEPDEIRAHVARFECSHLDDWTAELSKDLEREIVRDGALDVERLCKSDVLASWEGGDGGVAELGALTDWIDARKWYCGDTSGVDDAATIPVPKLSRSEPQADWRATLQLERGLASSSSAFPLAAGWIAVWRDSDLLRKTTAWYVDELAADHGSGDKRDWEIRRAVYVGDGLTASNAQRVVLARRGNEFTRAGKVILDVKARGANVRVATWRADPALAPPAKSWFPSRDDVTGFRAELAHGDLPVLVTGDGTISRWYSPRLGLVREEAPGVFRMELVFLGPKR
ncbi:MAG: hypothetical protein K8S98_08450 [Planctomycetes bacterium]|nr:hypothetical protein [Planctomycetota bacterium]